MRHLSVSPMPKSGKTVHLPQINSTPSVKNSIPTPIRFPWFSQQVGTKRNPVKTHLCAVVLGLQGVTVILLVYLCNKLQLDGTTTIWLTTLSRYRPILYQPWTFYSGKLTLFSRKAWKVSEAGKRRRKNNDLQKSEIEGNKHTIITIVSTNQLLKYLSIIGTRSLERSMIQAYSHCFKLRFVCLSSFFHYHSLCFSVPKVIFLQTAELVVNK